MTPAVVVSLTVAFLLAMAVSWRRERRSGMWLERATLAMLVVSVAGGFFALDAQSDRQDVQAEEVERNRIAADHAIRAAAVERTAQIEESRRDVLIRACREQNARYDETVRVLDERLAGLPSEQRARAAESRAFTIALIEGLVPHRHCAKRADRLIR